MNHKKLILTSLPLILIIIALVVGFIFFPESFDLRDKAYEGEPTFMPPTTMSTPAPALDTNSSTACTALYQPVCATNGVTYSNECEATKLGVVLSHNGACESPPATTN